MTRLTVWTDVHDLAIKAARRFDIPEPIVEPYDRRRRRKGDGDCYRATPGGQPLIRIRLHRYHRPRQPLHHLAVAVEGEAAEVAAGEEVARARFLMPRRFFPVGLIRGVPSRFLRMPKWSPPRWLALTRLSRYPSET